MHRSDQAAEILHQSIDVFANLGAVAYIEQAKRAIEGLRSFPEKPFLF